MKIRTVYFKIDDMQSAVSFWQQFLGINPVKRFEKYSEFKVSNINLGFVLNDFGDQFSGANCSVVFEFGDDEVIEFIERAKALGATVILDGLNDENIKGVVFRDPFGNEFEVTRFHD
jgi:catechol 2,3-dioxygenase-like lactoylglutathione lyase family enzyme